MKNQILFMSLLFAFTAQAEEVFVPKKFVWTYTVTAKDNTNFDDITKFNAQMRILIEEVKRNDNPSVYQSFLSFVQEVQEAIAAGLNLYGVAQTSVSDNIAESVATVVEEIIEQVIEQESDNVVEADTQHCKNIENVEDDASVNCEAQADEIITENTAVTQNVPMISIAISCVIADLSQTEAWDTATERLQALADAINANTLSAIEIVSEIDAVYNILQEVQNSEISLFAA